MMLARRTRWQEWMRERYGLRRDDLDTIQPLFLLDPQLLFRLVEPLLEYKNRYRDALIFAQILSHYSTDERWLNGTLGRIHRLGAFMHKYKDRPMWAHRVLCLFFDLAAQEHQESERQLEALSVE